MSRVSIWLRNNSDALQASANAVQVVALPLLIATIVVTIWQLKLTREQVQFAASQTQGQIIQTVGKDGRELFLKVWDDEGLRFLLDPRANGKKDPKKIEAFIGVVIGHYALVFRQWKLRNIPSEYWDEVVVDARQFFKSEDVSARWKDVKRFYKEDFREFVDKL